MKPEETRVVVVSPFRESGKRTREYHKVLAHLLCYRLAHAGYIVFASHVFCPLFLDEDLAEDRANGLRIERGWIDVSDRLAVWDLWGLSSGMQGAVEYAEKMNRIRRSPPFNGRQITIDYVTHGEVPEWDDRVKKELERTS
jgi:hypothetical protein